MVEERSKRVEGGWGNLKIWTNQRRGTAGQLISWEPMGGPESGGTNVLTGKYVLWGHVVKFFFKGYISSPVTSKISILYLSIISLILKPVCLVHELSVVTIVNTAPNHFWKCWKGHSAEYSLVSYMKNDYLIYIQIFILHEIDLKTQR